MTPEASEFTLYVLSGLALLTWIISSEFLRITARRIRESEHVEVDNFAIDLGEVELPESGRVDVKGAPGELSAKLASTLASGMNANVGPVELTYVDDRRVAFRSVASSLGRETRFGKVEGDIRFQQSKGGGTEAIYRLKTPAARGLMTAAWIVQFVGLAAIITMFLVMKFFVVDHPTVAIRFQVIQCLQLIHLLWPPFLLGGLARAQRGVAERNTRAMLVNLPYI